VDCFRAVRHGGLVLFCDENNMLAKMGKIDGILTNFCLMNTNQMEACGGLLL
jgi:hypothetical protein